MIKINEGESDKYEIVLDTRPPLVYLDHWALRRLSEEPFRKARFLAAFQRRGTLMFSLMNVVEIARDPEAARATQIRDLLEQIGPDWIPMTIDPLRIMDAEDSGATPDGAQPCVSPGFLADELFLKRITEGAPTLTHVVDLTRSTAGDTLRINTDADTTRLQSNFQDWRDAREADKRALERELHARFPRRPFNPAKPMRYIYQGLARLTITDGFTLDDNHMRDLFHACAAVRCAEMVTLDGHWAEQVRKLKLPPDFVRIYSEPELDQFLGDLESWTPATP